MNATKVRKPKGAEVRWTEKEEMMMATARKLNRQCQVLNSEIGNEMAVVRVEHQGTKSDICPYKFVLYIDGSSQVITARAGTIMAYIGGMKKALDIVRAGR